MLCKEIFAIRVKKLRKAHGEQQKELAEAIGATQATISDIENGRKATSFDRLAAICQHYNVSADYLLGLIDEPRTLIPPKKEGT
ncbi:helix-turn-helix domain-containing protein [Pseudoflavonifractor capillosus]|uniref:helix-turn-helix domain-containing protein n=1 Tax=Pseudoflavonifractor capillosus TaxID=106588 RepID=UPI00195C33FE|nr:helix-turn-helix transcriptional regulator [Pseudoflavonifractor capillosus]MBM6680265.1 helix-turn-helix transcriptional regulator [Pseudoflavonifractor capillosus]MBS6348418.1 helix-turn-helix transcriptional regulator [Oscillospiraceae bacterium]